MKFFLIIIFCLYSVVIISVPIIGEPIKDANLVHGYIHLGLLFSLCVCGIGYCLDTMKRL